MSGAIVPQTTKGNIVVDNVLASCYASFNHDLAHIGMTPVQWFPNIIKWITGMDDGSSAYLNTAKMFSRWILPYGQLWKY